MHDSPLITGFFALLYRKHREHLLQSLLHLRIHAALQKIEHAAAENGLTVRSLKEDLVQTNQEPVTNGDSSILGNEDFFDAKEDFVKVRRQDSNSSFDIISDDELNTI